MEQVKVCAGVGFHGGEKGDVLGCARINLDSSESSKGSRVILSLGVIMPHCSSYGRVSQVKSINTKYV